MYNVNIEACSCNQSGLEGSNLIWRAVDSRCVLGACSK
jgi:hypothetical protein